MEMSLYEAICTLIPNLRTLPDTLFNSPTNVNVEFGIFVMKQRSRLLDMAIHVFVSNIILSMITFKYLMSMVLSFKF
jgi:hypothetical protein